MSFPASLEARLEPLRRLGEGGMGEVWLARHRQLDQLRVVKLISRAIGSVPPFNRLHEATTSSM